MDPSAPTWATDFLGGGFVGGGGGDDCEVKNEVTKFSLCQTYIRGGVFPLSLLPPTAAHEATKITRQEV